MSSVQEQIVLIQGQISTAEDQLKTIILSKNGWKKAYDSANCRGKIGKKKRECEADKQNKLNTYNKRVQEESNKRSEINRLKSQLQTLIEQSEAESKATVLLAESGKTRESVLIETQIKGEAVKEESKAKIGMFIGVGVVLLAIASVYIYKKIKS